MTKEQLDLFNKKLSSYQKAELITAQGDCQCQYLLVWWLQGVKLTYRLDFIFTLYGDRLLRRYEIDGHLRSYVLKALEDILESE